MKRQFFESGLLEPGLRSIAKEGARNHGLLNVKPSEFLALRVSLPLLAEQRKIAAILSSVDEVIENTQGVIEQLRVVKQAMMAELLTRGIPGRHAKFKMTEIGEVPEGWEVVKLGELISEGPTNGLYKPQSDYGQGTPIVRIDAFANGEIINCTGLRLVRLSDSEISRFGVTPKDILVNRVNSLSHLAKTTLVGEVPAPTAFESNMMRFRVIERQLLPEFAFMVVCSERARAHFLDRAKQAVAQASVNQQDVRALPVQVPSLDEQKAIWACAKAVREREAAEVAALEALKDTKSALMSVLLTGDVRVQPDEDTA